MSTKACSLQLYRACGPNIPDKEVATWTTICMSITSANKSVRDARIAIQNGDIDEAVSLLQVPVKEDHPEALFLISQISAPPESEAEFNRRSLKQLRRAADLLHPEALYQISSLLEDGQEVEQDSKAARRLLERAALLGHPHALWRLGLTYLFPRHGEEKDLAFGKALIERAASKRSQGALRTLASFYEQGSNGYPKDKGKSDELTVLSDAEDVLLI